MIKLKLLFTVFLFSTYSSAQWVVQQVPTTDILIDIYFADSSHGWVTAGYDGIFYTSDGGYTWEQQYSSFAGNVSGLSETELWVGGKKDTLLHTTNSGINWEKLSLMAFTDLDSVASLTSIYFLDANIGWTYIVGWENGSDTLKTRLLKTTNGGLSWQIKINPLSSLTLNLYIQFFDLENGLMTGWDPTPIFRTTNGGESWDSLAFAGYMATFDMQFTTSDIGWISSDGPVLSTLIWKTINGGYNWLINHSFQCSYPAHLFFIDSLKGWVVQYSCLSGTEIWHTSDEGFSWDLQFIYTGSFSPWKMVFTDSLHGWIISRYFGTVLHTSTGGVIPVELTSFTAEVIEDGVMLNWTTATETNNQGFEIERQVGSRQSPVINWKKIAFVSGYGTSTEPQSYSLVDDDVINSVYQYRLKQIDYDGIFTYSNEIEVKVDFTPKELTLEQNYPNPFNSSTIIKYSLPQATNVTITVYDILGTGVKVLLNERKESGNYEVSFDVANLPSGVYVYKLETKNISGLQSIKKKMVIIK